MGSLHAYSWLVVMVMVILVVVDVKTVIALELKGDVAMGVPPAKGMAVGDDLATPEWLQNISQESKIAKYRKRRFINFPTGSRVDVELVLTVPTEGLSDSGTMVVENDLSFNLPNSSTVYYDYYGRSFGPTQQRVDLYGRVESFLSGLGYDGHACTLRTICEVAELPFQHGLFGEVVNLVLRVTGGLYNEVDGEELPDDDYALAEYYGRHHGSCYDHYPSCPFSILNFVSHVLPM